MFEDRVGEAGGAPPPREPRGAPPPREPRGARGVETGLAALLVAGAFAVVLANVQSKLFDLDRFTAPKALALELTALAAAGLLIPRWRRLEVGVVEGLLAAFVAWSALSTLLARNHWLAVQGFGVSLAGFVLFLAARRLASAGLRHAALTGLVAAAVIGGGLGVAQAYGVDWKWLADSRPPGGTYGNRNFLAHMTAIATPALLVLTLRARRRPAAAAGMAGLAIAAAAIVLTRSRAAWLALAVSLTVMALGVLLGRRRPLAGVTRRRIVAAVAALAVAVAASVLAPNELKWKSSSPYAETLTGLTNYKEGSGHGRLIQYRNSFRLIPRRPVFGVGPGNWFVHYPRVTTPGDPAFAGYDPIPTNPWPSSDWVAMITERGLVGALLLALAGLAAAVVAVRRLRDDGGRGEGDAAADALVVLGTLAAAFVAGQFDAVLLLPAPTYLVWATLGLLLPPTGAVVSRTLEGKRGRMLRRGVVGLLALVTLASAAQVAAVRTTTNTRRATLVRAARFYPGSHRIQLDLMGRGSCGQRLPHARAAARLMPFHRAPKRALAACGGK